MSKEDVMAEALQAYYATCAAAGIGLATANAYFAEEQLRALAALPPEPRYANEQLLREAAEADRRRQPELARNLSLDWLQCTHGATIGDVVSVYGWVRPREIVIDKFTLAASSGDADTVFMTFSGPTVFSQGVAMKESLTEASFAVCKISVPSKRLQRAFPDRFPG